MRRLAIAAVLLVASGFSAQAEDVTIKMSMSEFYRIVENVKTSGTYKAEKRLPAVRAWMVRQIESGKAVPDIAIPAPVVLDDTTVRPKFATREYKSGEKVFLLGDSITQNAGAHRFGYDKLLKKGLEVWGKTDVKVINHGRSGSTTCWMRGEAQKPDWDWLFLEAGINDANKDWWWDGVITNYTGNVTELDSFRHPENHPTAGKCQDFCANVLDIVRKSKAAGAQVILATTTCNGECNRAWWFARHEPSLREHTKYNPMYREIARAEQVPLIDFWKYWVGGPYLKDDGTPAPEEYVGFIETNKLRSCEKLMEGRDDVFLSDDNTHLYFQGYRDIARRLLTVMGCPASKMPEIEKVWWDMPEVYDVKLSLPAELHAKIKAGAAAAGVSAGKYVHDVILFPVGKSSGPFAPRKMNGTWVSMGTSITWRNDHVPKKPENAIKGLTRGYQDRVRDVLAFDGFRNLGCNGGTIGIQLGSVAPGAEGRVRREGRGERREEVEEGRREVPRRGTLPRRLLRAQDAQDRHPAARILVHALRLRRGRLLHAQAHGREQGALGARLQALRRADGRFRLPL